MTEFIFQTEDAPLKNAIYYASNQIWLWCMTLEKLAQIADIQIKHAHYTFDSFLDNSLQKEDYTEFGTYNEYNGKSLREHLRQEGQLEEFINYYNQTRNHGQRNDTAIHK
jgi:hypothetical protein